MGILSLIPLSMTLRSRLLIAVFAMLSIPLISSAMEGTSTSPRVYTATEIAYIRGINCDTFTSTEKTRCLEIKKAALSQSQTGTTLPPPRRETQSGATEMHHTPEHTQSGSEMEHPKPPASQTGTIEPTNSGEKGIKDPAVKGCGSCSLTGRQMAPSTGSGADMEREVK